MFKLLLASAISAVISLPNGDQIPDYSRMGYRWGDKEIPTVKVVKKLSAPQGGADATELIQNAIDGMKKPGAVLLKAGTYYVSGTININHSGVVVRGEGADKTVIIASGTKQRSLFVVGNPAELKIERNLRAKSRICKEYVPYGSLYVPVEKPQNFKPGDRIIVHETHNQAWVKAIRMDRIMQFKDYFDRCVNQWTPETYSYEYERVVSKVDGNKIWLDAPIILALYPEYGGGEVYPYSCNRIEECGVENLSAVSEFDKTIKAKYGYSAPETRGEDGYFSDELHAWRFVEFRAAEHCWLRNCTCKHFGYSLATTGSTSKNITVTDCQSFAPVSRITGARRYGLDCCGQLALFKNCKLDHDRHGMVTHVSCAGPNAYVNCEMTNAHEDAGPHNNWGVGTLHDCCKTSQDINVQDRQGSGTGHGWAGASIVMWNCEARRICAQSVWGVHNNYVVGCISKKWSGWFGEPADKLEKRYRDMPADGLPADYEPRPEAIFVSHGKKVEPLSLYAYQMNERKAAGIKAVPDEYYKKNKPQL